MLDFVNVKICCLLLYG